MSWFGINELKNMLQCLTLATGEGQSGRNRVGQTSKTVFPSVESKCGVVVSAACGHDCFKDSERDLLCQALCCFPHTYFYVGSIILILPKRELRIREKNLSKATSCRLQTFSTHKVPSAGRFLNKKMRCTFDLGSTMLYHNVIFV